MTSSIRSTMRSALAAATLLAGAMACSGKSKAPTLASDLQGDLAAAQSSSIELANEGTHRTQVVSAEELTTVPAAGPDRAVAMVTVPRVVVHKAQVGNKPTLAPTPSPTPTVLAPKPQSPELAIDTLRSTGGNSTVAQRPSNTSGTSDTLGTIGPRPSPNGAGPTRSRHGGGYKSVGEVIRNAPFPINP